MEKKIHVLIVDDSHLVRESLTEILASDPMIEIIGAAPDAIIASEIIAKKNPDVILLDIEMPRMDGLTFLKKIMDQHPMRVVICSSLSVEGSEIAFKAFEYGAVEIITKPKLGTHQFFEEAKIHICDVVKAAAKVDLNRKSAWQTAGQSKLSADAIQAKSESNAMAETTEKIIVVGASTGGTEALKTFLESLPLDTPGIAIVQHMPEHFTKAFAKKLDSLCKISVKEAQDGDSLIRGRALIAPGNFHMLVKRSGASYYVEIKDGPLVSRHRPSVDVLFRSACRYAGKNAIGIILTGMGDDGAKGLLELKENGAHTIVQDEKSCVVFGMPNEAIKLGAAVSILPLDRIASHIITHCN